MKKIAFPLLETAKGSTQLVEVAQNILDGVRDVLSFTSVVRKKQDDHFLHAEYRYRDVRIPLTFIGNSDIHGEGAVLVHSPGLPGAFPIEMAELKTYRHQFAYRHNGAPSDDHPVNSLGFHCLLEAIEKGDARRGILEHLLYAARRRSFLLDGMTSLLGVGEQIQVSALLNTFPYHSGGSQAVKRYFDITDEMCTLFCGKIKSGTKVLCRYGIAVSVGVAVDTTLGCPALFWNPSGAPAACLAPLFHSCPILPIGYVPLDYNGPAVSSELLTCEDPSRYWNPSAESGYDTSVWLNEGLFGLRPGQEIKGADVVAMGTVYNAKRQEFELMVKDEKTGVVKPWNF